MMPLLLVKIYSLYLGLVRRDLGGLTDMRFGETKGAPPTEMAADQSGRSPVTIARYRKLKGLE